MNLVERYPFKKPDEVKVTIRDVIFKFSLAKSAKAKPNVINVSVS